MSGPSFRSFRLSRRRVSALLLNGAALWATRALAGDPASADRGLGGTGAARVDPAETLGQDRGIGGTGVVGTIRRFGSIVVNDLRVTFPADVRVSIDGRPATRRDLRIGHVARVLARHRGGVLTTRAIVVRSEVIGPITSAGPRGFVLVGQRVKLEEGLPALGYSDGDMVAVSGLRRLDGTVVASLVEPRPPGPERLSGPVATASDETLTIGTLRIAGLAPHLAGRRVSLVGGTIDGLFHPTSVEVEPDVPFAAADRLSIEGYVAQVSEGVRFGSGLGLPGSTRPSATSETAAEPEGVRAIVTARADPSGRLGVETVRVEHEGRNAGRGAHRAPAVGERSPPSGRPGGTGPHGDKGGTGHHGGGGGSGGSHGGGGGGGGGHGGR